MPYDITYMRNLKYSTNEHIYQTETLTDVEIRLWLPRWGRGGRVIDWEFEVGRCKLLHLERTNKALLYSTGNYIRSPGIYYNGK